MVCGPEHRGAETEVRARVADMPARTRDALRVLLSGIIRERDLSRSDWQEGNGVGEYDGLTEVVNQKLQQVMSPCGQGTGCVMTATLEGAGTGNAGSCTFVSRCAGVIGSGGSDACAGQEECAAHLQIVSSEFNGWVQGVAESVSKARLALGAAVATAEQARATLRGLL